MILNTIFKFAHYESLLWLQSGGQDLNWIVEMNTLGVAYISGLLLLITLGKDSLLLALEEYQRTFQSKTSECN